ncbi:D-alanyl-D-alanine carboxypeptidase/D-alanyl-D-alanine-endopeptidase [Castellaniella caeni]
MNRRQCFGAGGRPAHRVVKWLAQLGLGLGLLAGVAGAALAQALPPELQKAWKATKLPDSSLSLEIREAGGPVISRINAEVPRNPASVMKTVTTWSALSTLGPDYVWRTQLLSNAGARVDEQGTLQGPLYVKAGGDPWFTVADLWGMLNELRLRGIKNLTDVVVNRSLFGNVSIDPGEFDDAPDRPYNASADAMMVDFGAARIIFQPDEKHRQWVTIVDPPTRNVRVDGQLQWEEGRCKPATGFSVDARVQDHVTTIRVAGKATGSCGEFSVYRLAGSQADHFEALFRMLWQNLGGTLGRGFQEGKIPARTEVLTWHDSPALSDVIRQINKHSNNVMARMTLLTVAAEVIGSGATPETGDRAVTQILQRQKVDTTGWVLDNGSGLSRQGRITAQGLAQMLDYAWRSPLMPEFVSSLSISGMDGTMRKRLRSADTKGQAHLKTGTLKNSRALAGYVRGASGKRYILVSLVNHPGAAAVRAFDDEIVRWLAAR